MKQLKRSLSLVLALVMLMSLVYWAPKAEAATASSYISTTYASSLSVKTTQATALRELPTTTASAKYTLPTDTMLTVKALHKSTAGTYWYEVLFYDMTLYVDATATTMVSHLVGDISTSDMVPPASLAEGASFPLSGTITSTENQLGTVTAAMYWGNDLTIAPKLSASDTANSMSYTLDDSTIDSAMSFGSLATGVYTYTVSVEAISYYISDSDALTKATNTVLVERNRCIITDYTDPNDIMGWGVDVSVWNGSIDWELAANDLDFAILRSSFEETTDNRFVEYANGCEENGIPFGIYVYSYAETVAEAEAEANYAINLVKGYDMMQLPIFFDAEDSVLSALGGATLREVTKAFIEVVREAGYTPGIYTTSSWFTNYYYTDYFNSVAKWIAQIDGYYGGYTCSYNGGLHFWQYSWEGSCSGIYSTGLDVNYCYDLLPGMTNDTTYRSQCTAYNSNLTVTTSSSVTMRAFPCSASVDSTSTAIQTVASGTQLHVTAVYKNTAGEYWYQVDNGSSVGYIPAANASVTAFRYDDLAVLEPTMASNLDVGSGYYLQGNLTSQFNSITTAYAKIYSGEDTQVSPVLSSSGAVNSTTYNLYDSTVCDNLIFSNLSAGYYTYEISADVKNYYVSGGSLTSTTENVVLWTAPFTVGSATIEPPAQMVCEHTIVTDAAVAATCTTTGLTAGTHCSKCNVVLTAQTVVAATGHSYTATSEPANCQNYELFHYTCSKCGDTYDISADELATWSETKPVGVSSSLIESKTQYRYADCTSTTWQENATNTILYVNSWPSGFSTSSSLYTQYNKKSSKVTASETTSTKTVINSDKVTGYLYYHWCYSDSYYSTEYSTGSYTTFHAYYDTTSPDNYTCDTSDMSYKTSHSTCSNSNWWFVAEVYGQNYTTYKAVPDGQEWGAWSAWSDTAFTAVTNSRKVETRTVYRYTGAALGDHVWSNGTCTVCGTTCSHSYSSGTCTICGMGEPNSDYYLFGYINGADYACEGDYENIGTYLFVDGKLTTTFTQTSYVAVKTGDNAHWYMTNGWQGEVSSATLFDTSITGDSSDKLYVPGNVEVTFTLVENNDGTLTLSYTTSTCTHASHGTDGLCTSCGEAVSHTYVDSVCSVCGLTLTTPTLTPNYPTVSFEGAIQLNIYYTAADLGTIGLEDMGLLVFTTAQPNGTIDTASSVVSGATQSGDKYIVHTNGIAAKNLGDTLYLKVYARMADGTYAYSKMISTSPKAYALTIIKNTSNNDYVRALCVSMLNYGAAAQQYFGYKSYDLMNASLTTDQLALVSDYDASMMDDVVAVSGIKGGAFVRNTTAFTNMYPTVSFEGAFSINYYFVNGLTVDDNMTMYYWTADTYNSVSQLTRANADGSIIMTDEGTRYWGIVDNIAAKNMDSTIYVAGVYTSGGTNYTTGIIAYSLGRYCESIAGNTSNDAQDLAAKTAVYGYYAECYFDWLYG